MTDSLTSRQRSTASSDPLTILNAVSLSEAEKRYAGGARAADTLRGYRADWKEWCAWCNTEALPRFPPLLRASPAT